MALSYELLFWMRKKFKTNNIKLESVHMWYVCVHIYV